MKREHCRSRSASYIFALLLTATVGSSGYGCGRRSAPTVDTPQRLWVTTAFASFSRPLIEEYQRALPQLDIKPIAAADSNAVVHALEHGDADLGLAYADAVFAAYGTVSRGHSATALRGVSVLEPLPLYVLVRNDAHIEHIADLRDRRLASLSNSTLVRLFLNALGVDSTNVRLLPREALFTGLADGTLDAALISAWVPDTGSEFVAIQQRAHVLSVDGPVIQRLRTEYPFIRRVTVPRVLYSDQLHAVNTIGMDVLVVCRAGLSAALVYEATKHLFLAYSRLSSVEATLRFLDLDEAAATPIPLHPGAARYFRERELSR